MVGVAVDHLEHVPNAIVFRTSAVGFAGTGACAYRVHCASGGTISVTTDGGKSWRVLRSTPRPVIAVSVAGARIRATYDNDVVVLSRDGGRTWRRVRPSTPPRGPCPAGPNRYLADRVVVTPAGRRFALCVGQPGAGNQEKSVFRRRRGRWRRIAWAPLGPGGYGGISTYGYPVGMEMSDSGFGLLWESRGTLYVTRDGGHHWTAEPRIARPELDFGLSGDALSQGVGHVLLARGAGPDRRLLETTDSGRSWHVVRRWR